MELKKINLPLHVHQAICVWNWIRQVRLKFENFISQMLIHSNTLTSSHRSQHNLYERTAHADVYFRAVYTGSTECLYLLYHVKYIMYVLR